MSVEAGGGGFDDFLASLRHVARRVPLVETEEHGKVRAVVAALEAIEAVDREAVVNLLSKPNGAVRPDVGETLGLIVGLGRERLTSELRAGLPGAVDRAQPGKIVDHLDQAFGLLTEIESARGRRFGWADVLVARAGSRGTAGAAIQGGRGVEDRIEAAVRGLRLPYRVRTRFEGRSGQTAPADLAIPDDGSRAQIVCAAKGFDSTGSKLTDAVREIEEMANVRRPTQYVLAVVDGIGWFRRRADLQRIYGLYERGEIDGLYSLAMLAQFGADVIEPRLCARWLASRSESRRGVVYQGETG